jgi:hypothetical protein
MIQLWETGCRDCEVDTQRWSAQDSRVDGMRANEASATEPCAWSDPMPV